MPAGCLIDGQGRVTFQALVKVQIGHLPQLLERRTLGRLIVVTRESAAIELSLDPGPFEAVSRIREDMLIVLTEWNTSIDETDRAQLNLFEQQEVEK